jgi:preprotein translocase subunit SecF
MEFLHDTHIDFMKYRRFWIIVSFVLVALGLYTIFGPHKLNLGIDFAGGTQITLGFRETPEIDRIRTLVEQAGMREAVIQRIGKPEENQVNIKTAAAQGTEEGSRERLVAALSKSYNQGKTGVDLNQTGLDDLTQALVRANPDRVAPPQAGTHYAGIAETILKDRLTNGIFKSMDRIARLPGVSPAVVSALQQGAHLGDFSVLGTENVGPQIGKELRSQGFWAVVLSMLGMLCYIWFRFELRFGIGAIMASLHDVLVTLFFFTLAGHEFNLTTVAAFLTLVGYSVNDTVVIFDRIRENMRKHRREPLLEVMNRSINETLSRTILTGGTTLLAVLSLLIFGGEVIRGFAFVMFVGILVGTYSSIYVASPFALLWEQLFGPQGRIRGQVAPARQTPAGRTAPTRPAPEVPQQPKPETPTPRRPESRRRAGGGRR